MAATAWSAVVDVEHDAAYARLVRDAVDLDDDALSPELGERRHRLGSGRGVAERGKPDAVAGEQLGRLQLGQCARAGERVGRGWRRRQRRSRPARRDIRDRTHRVARSAQQREVELVRERLEVARRVGAVHRRACAEEAVLVGQAGEGP